MITGIDELGQDVQKMCITSGQYEGFYNLLHHLSSNPCSHEPGLNDTNQPDLDETVEAPASYVASKLCETILFDLKC